MLLLIKLFGVIVVGLGAICVTSPDSMKQMMDYFLKGKRIYGIGVIRIILGILFLLVASQCKLPGVIYTLGVFLIVAGSLIFVFRLEKCKSMITNIMSKSNTTKRLLGLPAIAIGILIFCSV